MRVCRAGCGLYLKAFCILLSILPKIRQASETSEGKVKCVVVIHQLARSRVSKRKCESRLKSPLWFTLNNNMTFTTNDTADEFSHI